MLEMVSTLSKWIILAAVKSKSNTILADFLEEYEKNNFFTNYGSLKLKFQSYRIKVDVF